MRRRTFAWATPAFALLIVTSSAWAPPPTGGRPIGGGSGRPVTGGIRTGNGTAGKAAVRSTFESIRSRNPTDAARFLMGEDAAALSRTERAALMNGVVSQLLGQLRQHHIPPQQQLAKLRQLRSDWNVMVPGADLDAGVDLELAAAEAAAERRTLRHCLTAIEEKRYTGAAAELVEITESRYLPASAVQAISRLITDLKQLVDAINVKPEGVLPIVIAVDNVPYAIKLAIARVESIQFTSKLITNDTPPRPSVWWKLETVNKRLEWLSNRIGLAEAAELRVELSAAAFLMGKTDDATALLDGDIDTDHARQVLADLRAFVSGDGSAIATPELARFILPEGLAALPAIASLVSPGQRESWRVPKPPNEKETTLAKLEKAARKHVALVVGTEIERLLAKVKATIAMIRVELAKQTGPLAAFEEKVKARLGRPIEHAAEKDLVAYAAIRELNVDDVVVLLAAEADRPAQAARLVSGALAPDVPSFCAQIAVAARPPASLKAGEDGSYRLPVEVIAHDRVKLRETARIVVERYGEIARNRGLPTNKEFEIAITRLCGVQTESVTRGEFVYAVLDASRDLADEYIRALDELRELGRGLDGLRDADLKDPEIRAEVYRAQARNDALRDAASRQEAALQYGCTLLGGYGQDSAPAVPWLLLTAKGDAATWRTAASAALAKIIPSSAPVPKGARQSVECIVTRDTKLAPSEEKAFTVELKNNTDKTIEMYSTLPFGVLVFLDIAIEDADGKRISPEFYDRSIASPVSPAPRLIGKLEGGKGEKIELSALTRYLEKPENLKPGKYRVRVKFRYGDFTAISEWQPIEIPK